VARLTLDAIAGAGDLATSGGTTETAGTMNSRLLEREIEVAMDAEDALMVTVVEFLTHYQAELYQYALHLTRRRADADGLYLDTLLNAVRDVDCIDGAATNRAWLYKIATTTYLSSRNGSDGEEPLDADCKPDEQEGDSMSHNIRDHLSEVSVFVDRLPARQRFALILRRYQGLRYSEIAACLGTSENGARADVYQALRTLHDQFANPLSSPRRNGR
jgi:RNA polymerase sigma-70 factor (ECF subfamily)